jgi:hypothetical protein
LPVIAVAAAGTPLAAVVTSTWRGTFGMNGPVRPVLKAGRLSRTRFGAIVKNVSPVASRK